MDLKNQAVVLVRAGIAKKVGRPNYSSYEASLQIELTTDLGAVTDERFPDLMGTIYDKIQRQIDIQIAEEVNKDKPAQAQALPTPPPKEELQHNDISLAAEQASKPAFGEYLSSKSVDLGQAPQLLVKFWYKQFVDGPDVDFNKQGKALNDLWKAGSLGPSHCEKALTNFPQF